LARLTRLRMSHHCQTGLPSWNCSMPLLELP
jgi:hypothetical protein